MIYLQIVEKDIAWDANTVLSNV